MKQYLFKPHYNISFEKGQIPHLFNLYKIYGDLDKDIRCVHVHENALELAIVKRGSCVSIVDGRYYELKQGDIQVINAGISHEQNYGICKDLIAFSVGIKNLNVKELRENTLIPDGILPVLRSDEYFDTICKLFDLITLQLDRQYERATETSNYLMLSIITILLNILNEGSVDVFNSAQSNSEMLTREVCKYIDMNYRNDITLDDMASYANINKYYMTRTFKSVLGYPPIQYLIRRRIGEAQFLLVETEKSVSEIATEVGFNTLSHFSSTFSKVLSTTPGKYRRDVLSTYYKNPGLRDLDPVPQDEQE